MEDLINEIFKTANKDGEDITDKKKEILNLLSE